MPANIGAKNVIGKTQVTGDVNNRATAANITLSEGASTYQRITAGGGLDLGWAR